MLKHMVVCPLTSKLCPITYDKTFTTLFMMQYNKINNLLGWFCLVIAMATYVLTLEPSVSFWDCGEFIACAYRLQVSHQPGLPYVCHAGQSIFAAIHGR
jgi:hypothetical protein